MIDATKTGIQNLQGITQPAAGSLRKAGKKDRGEQVQRESFEASVGDVGKAGMRYPNITAKLFGALDELEKAVNGLSNHPTQQQVSDAKLRNIARWIQVLSDAYADSYDGRDLEKAQKPIHELAEIAGEYKDADLVETEMKALYKGGRIPKDMAKDIAELKEQKAEEFHEFFKKFKHKKLEHSLEILRNPAPVDPDRSPAEIARDDRRHLAAEVGRLIDRIGEKGLFHDDSETLHDGRKAMRNLYAMIFKTDDVLSYDKSDVDALFKLFIRYGEPQDKHIAQMWAEGAGYEHESKFLRKKEKELQQSVMEDAAVFLRSGALEHIRETVNKGI